MTVGDRSRLQHTRSLSHEVGMNRNTCSHVASLILLVVLHAATLAADEAAQELPVSRAAWWLAQDDVTPISDLVNGAEPGEGADFADRVGDFSVVADGRALVITGEFPEANVWRFDLATFDGQFDMRKLYMPDSAKVAFPDKDSIQSRRVAALLGDPEKGVTHTGPWSIFNGRWLLPTARVSLDGKHIYTSWFDAPSLTDEAANRVYASFALDIPTAGKHTIRVSFDDFVYGTRWRTPRWNGDKKPPITRSPNDLRPHHIGSIAIGVDERVRMLGDITFKPGLRQQRPRMPDAQPARGIPAEGLLTIKDVEEKLIHVDFNRGETWEYCVDAESMASANDMDAGKNATQAARSYDAVVARLSPEARKEWDRLYLERFGGLYTFFVFQRNYHPTGYAQNHSSATVQALISGAIAWDGPEAEKWLRWGVMTCRKRIELLGRDGGVEWMNETRDYGLGYFERPLELIKYATDVDLTQNQPFFHNEWRYGLHQSPAFPTDESRRPVLISMGRVGRGRDPRSVAVPENATPENTPTSHHFDDVDQVFMRSDWGEDAYRARLWAGSVFGKQAAPIAKRYNWAHCRVNQGSFVLFHGRKEIILEAGWTRTYRKSASNNNCILVNGHDQWGGGEVWHPRLEPDQISHVAHFADGNLMSTSRADLSAAYPPEAKVRALSRMMVHIRPATFLVFDRLETDGPGEAQWRYHAAFIEPSQTPGRYTAFGYTPKAASGFKDKSQTYDEAFQKDAEVHCDVALLTPGVKATTGMTDAYFRWSKFSQPTRHLRVEQTGDGPLVLLTAFGPDLKIRSAKNVHRGETDVARWVAIVGPGEADGLASDAHFALCVEDKKSKRAELLRFGGSKLSLRGTAVESDSADVYAEMDGSKIIRTITTERKKP